MYSYISAVEFGGEKSFLLLHIVGSVIEKSNDIDTFADDICNWTVHGKNIQLKEIGTLRQQPKVNGVRFPPKYHLSDIS